MPILAARDGDLRARERTFQLLHQVSGRAGRAEKPGLVLMQTRNPEDAVMQALATATATVSTSRSGFSANACTGPALRPAGRDHCVAAMTAMLVREIAAQLGQSRAGRART